MAKLIYLHTYDRPYGKAYSGPGHTATNKFAKNFLTDGVCALLDNMARTQVISHVYAFIHSNRGCGELNYTPDLTVQVTPRISECLDYLEPDDIIWIRGGFKPWIPTIKEAGIKRKHWVLFYRANTGNGHWPYWDVILNDLVDRPRVNRHGVLNWPYAKPVNESIFRPIIPANTQYDLMLGASHIHGRKGQFRAASAMCLFESKHRRRLKGVLPGGFIHSGHNSCIVDLMQKGKIDLDLAGHMERGCLCKLMNRCTVFIHAGTGGQNDRGVLEALRCGIPTIIKDPKRYSPWVGNNTNYVTVCNSNLVSDWVEAIHMAYLKIQAAGDPLQYRSDIAKWYYENNGLYSVALPRMAKLFKFLETHPDPESVTPGDWQELT